MRSRNAESNICILSGLEIPPGKKSLEHLVPRSYVEYPLYNLKENKFYAIKVINNIKGARLPCEWFDTRVNLCYNALQRWNLTRSDRKIIIEALDRFATEKESLVPCQLCILSRIATEYCYERRDLEIYRLRWLYGIQPWKSKEY